MTAISATKSRWDVSWVKDLLNLLPLWLITIAVSGEGFPAAYKPSILAAELAFGAAILLGVALVWKGWLPPLLFVYSFFPLSLLYVFDEISTAHKTPYLLQCAFIASLFALAYLRLHSPWRVLLLITGAGAVYLLAWMATGSYWAWVETLQFGQCFPGASDCPPLPDVAWWRVFWRVG